MPVIQVIRFTNVPTGTVYGTVIGCGGTLACNTMRERGVRMASGAQALVEILRSHVHLALLDVTFRAPFKTLLPQLVVSAR